MYNIYADGGGTLVREREKIMKIYGEKSLRYFEFWSGAKDRACLLTCEELDQVEAILEDAYPEGMSETEVNDLFWFDFDSVAQWLGYESEDALFEDRESDDD